MTRVAARLDPGGPRLHPFKHSATTPFSDAIATASANGKQRPTVVTIGHSCGARALSHAVAACPFFENLTIADCRAVPSVDIVIGLEGAYNRSRFFAPDPDGSYPDGTLDLYIFRDGSPLQRYDALLGNGTRHFLCMVGLRPRYVTFESYWWR